MDTIEPVQKSGQPASTALDARSIQPAGFLLALSADWIVERVSANVGGFLGREPDQLIGAPASDFLADDAIHALRNRLALLRDPDGIERIFACRLTGDERASDVAIHVADDTVIVEAEPSTTNLYGDVTGTLRGMLGRLELAPDFPQFLTAGARQLRALTGYDRVMITRIEADGSGAVVAECERSGLGSYLGRRFPAGTLSQEQRSRFMRSPLHVVVDVDADPALLVSDIAEPLDLSRSVLRCASPARLEQLRAMDARASQSIALIVNRRLWGLIACHHHAPRSPSFERRSMAELFAQMFAMRIEIAELKTGTAEPRA
ncbi:MAG: GAF domain-containing protein [Pseudomonadota bacterium]|nr:GAF domain-containing protein [Pseudomonadota bacterium]